MQAKPQMWTTQSCFCFVKCQTTFFATPTVCQLLLHFLFSCRHFSACCTQLKWRLLNSHNFMFKRWVGGFRVFYDAMFEICWGGIYMYGRLFWCGDQGRWVVSNSFWSRNIWTCSGSVCAQWQWCWFFDCMESYTCNFHEPLSQMYNLRMRWTFSWCTCWATFAWCFRWDSNVYWATGWPCSARSAFCQQPTCWSEATLGVWNFCGNFWQWRQFSCIQFEPMPNASWTRDFTTRRCTSC